METAVIFIGVGIIVLLAWGIRLIRIDLKESDAEIEKLVQENLKLIDKIFELNKNTKK